MTSTFTRPDALHVAVRLEAGLTEEQQARISAASPASTSAAARTLCKRRWFDMVVLE